MKIYCYKFPEKIEEEDKMKIYRYTKKSNLEKVKDVECVFDLKNGDKLCLSSDNGFVNLLLKSVNMPHERGLFIFYELSYYEKIKLRKYFGFVNVL